MFTLKGNTGMANEGQFTWQPVVSAAALKHASTLAFSSDSSFTQ